MAFLEVEPPREAWPGLAPIAMVIAAVDATAFPNASRTATVGGPGMAPPAGALDGCFVKASALAAPAVMVSGAAPVLPAASVAITLVVSAAVPCALARRTPPVSALAASPKTPSASASNST